MFIFAKIKNMDDIEMRERGDPPPEDREDEGEAETTFNHPDDDREEETNELEWEYPTDAGGDLRKNLDEMREADRDLGRGIGVRRREITGTKKSILFDLGYKLRKGDGKKSAELFNRLKLTTSEKTGDVNGVTFDNAKIII